MSLRAKIVVITGAAGGIGSRVAQAYADEGAVLVLLDKHRAKLNALAKRLDHGGGVQAIPCDLAKPKQVEAVFDALEQVDVLVNNAGTMITKPMLELTVAEWDKVVNTNLRGTFLCSQAAARRMPRGGSIVNIASTRALMSERDTEAYSASKGGILSLTHAMAISLADRGIRVNAISPGWIENGSYESLRQADHNWHPSGRVGRPDDIARACLFFSNPRNDFVTGANLVVDGGVTRKMVYLD